MGERNRDAGDQPDAGESKQGDPGQILGLMGATLGVLLVGWIIAVKLVKRVRREQLAWADRNNLLHKVQMFFDAMPTSCWERLER